jgi:hypothetical protein
MHQLTGRYQTEERLVYVLFTPCRPSRLPAAIATASATPRPWDGYKKAQVDRGPAMYSTISIFVQRYI